MMAMHKVQFQKGLSLDRFLKLYESEGQCADAVAVARWLDGDQCSRCECKRVAMTQKGHRLRDDDGSDKIAIAEVVSVSVFDDVKSEFNLVVKAKKTNGRAC
jgi:hypothetical protein